MSFVPVNLNKSKNQIQSTISYVKTTAQSTTRQSQSTIQETESENKILHRSVRLTPKTQFILPKGPGQK